MPFGFRLVIIAVVALAIVIICGIMFAIDQRARKRAYGEAWGASKAGVLGGLGALGLITALPTMIVMLAWAAVIFLTTDA